MNFEMQKALKSKPEQPNGGRLLAEDKPVAAGKR
jgi:hypothetical protein